MRSNLRARTLGGVIDQGDKGIMEITLDPKENPMADYLRGIVLWHIDGDTPLP